MKILIAIIFVLFFATGCGPTTPDDPDLMVPQRPGDTQHSNDDLGPASVNIDFYIQATSYMAGFARATGQAGQEGHFADVLYLLSYAANRLDGGVGAVHSYYRFDVINYDGPGNTPYRLDGGRNQFEQEAAISPLFFSIPWYFKQDARHPVRFEELLLPPFENHYRTNFLSDTINRANRDHISIIVTDLVEPGFNPNSIIASLSNIISDQNKAVFMFAFRLPFIGNVYNNTYPPEGDIPQPEALDEWQPLWHDGTRPLYVLVIGEADKVFMYSDLLISSLSAQIGLMFDYTFFHRSNGIDTVYNLHRDTPILRDTTAEIYRNPGPQVRWYNGSGLRDENGLLAESIILYLDVHSTYREAYARLDVSIPFTMPPFWVAEDISMYLTHEIEYLRSTRAGWYPVPTDTTQRIVDNSSISWASEDELRLTLNIDVARSGHNQTLRTLGSYQINRFRITTYVHVRQDSQIPDWANYYASAENNPLRIQENSIFGEYTIGLSHILTQLALRAGSFGYGEDSSGVAANIMVYAIVDQRIN